MAGQQNAMIAIGVVLVFGMLVACFFAVKILRPWLKAVLNGAPVTAVHIVGMRLRSSPVDLLVDTYVKLRAQGYHGIDLSAVEQCYLAEGRAMMDAEELIRLVHKANPPCDQLPMMN